MATTTEMLVVIHVRNGMTEVVHKPEGVKLVVIDYDVENVDADVCLDRDRAGDNCIISVVPADRVINKRTDYHE